MKKKIKKLPIILSASAVGALGFALTIYFSQTLYFYQMKSVETKSGNSVQTIYSHDAYVTKKYPRTIPQTYGWNETYTKLDGTTVGTPTPTTGVDINEYNANPQKYWPSGDYSVINQSFYVEIVKWEDQTFANVDWVKKQIEQGTLKKHPVADYQYKYENRVLDSTPAVEKIFNLDLTQPGFITTGLYIPAGEIVTLDFPGLTDKQVSDLNIQIVLGENDAVNMNSDFASGGSGSRGFNRMPKMKTVTKIDSAHFRFGTPFGGIIHINNTKQQTEKNVSMVANGAIEALHYIHGYTTQKEWNRLINEAQAPVYDVSSDHMKFIGPKHTFQPFTKDKDGNPAPQREDNYYPYDSISLYDKMSLDALYTINDNANWLQPVRHTFSKFVPYGAACSYVRAFYVVAPWEWSNNFWNYNSINTSGAWGIMHENNHQHQSGVWGFEGHGEVSNNVLTLISYLKYTDINTQLIGGDRSGHLSKLNASGVIGDTNNEIKKNQGNVARGGYDTDYSTLLTQFGVDALQNTIRSYSDKTITAKATGLPVTDFPDSIAKRRNAKFIYRISEIIGYNYADYALNCKLITQEDYNSLMDTDTIKNLSEYVPVQSGYASYTKYGVNPYFSDAKDGSDFYVSNWNDRYTNFNYLTYRDDGFNYMGRPNVIKKDKNGNYPKTVTFNLKENDVTGYTTDENKIKIIKAPKGELKDNGNGSFTYTPLTNDKNYIDKFVFEKTVSKDSNPNIKKTAQFEVDIKLEDNDTKFVNPDITVPQYYSEQSRDESKNVTITTKWPVDKDGAERPGKLTGSDATTGFQNINEILNNTNPNKWWWENYNNEKGDDKDIIINMKPNGTVNFNSLEIQPWKANNSQTPDGLIIEADGKEVYNGTFIKSDKSTYNFSNTTAKDNIKLTFRKFTMVQDGVDPSTGGAIMVEKSRSTNLALRSIKLSMSTKPNQILTPDSEWIHKIGDWREGNNDGKVNGKSLFTIFPQSKLQFAFSGTSFSITGTKDIGYGSFDVYVDGSFKKTVSTSSDTREPNSPLYILTDLPEGDHVVSILTNNSSPVEIQYLALQGEAKPIQVNDWFYFLTIGIPLIVILIIALISVSVALYLKNKNKKISFDFVTKHFKQREPNKVNSSTSNIQQAKVVSSKTNPVSTKPTNNSSGSKSKEPSRKS